MTVQYKYVVQKASHRDTFKPALGGGIADHIIPDWFDMAAPEEDNHFFAHATARSDTFIKEN